MQLTAPKNALLSLLRRAQKVADKRATMPILSHCLIATSDGRLNVAATDLALSVTGAVLDCEVKRPGSFALPADEFYQRIDKMPDGPIKITIDDKLQAIIQAPGSQRRYTLHCLPAGDFPAMPSRENAKSAAVLPAASLSWLIASTSFSISGDETRAHLNAALLELEPGRARMVTTDGHRLTKAELAVDGVACNATLLLPARCIKELRSMLDDQKRQEGCGVTMAWSGPHCFFDVAGVLMTTKITDAQFPPYAAVIPPEDKHVLTAPRAALLDCIKAVAIATAQQTGGVKFTAASGGLKVTAESPDGGAAVDEVPADYEGPEVLIGLCSKYMIEVLSALDCEQVRLGLCGELDPVVVRPAGDGAAEFCGVVMPMKL